MVIFIIAMVIVSVLGVFLFIFNKIFFVKWIGDNIKIKNDETKFLIWWVGVKNKPTNFVIYQYKDDFLPITVMERDWE